MIVNESRLPVWAGAQSIYGCALNLFPARTAQCLYPRLLPDNEILLGKALVFSDHQFLNLLKHGLGMPRVVTFLLSPYHSACTLVHLFKIGRLYKKNHSKASCFVQLGGSLAAICTYMNYQKKACTIFEPEKKYNLLVGISGSEKKYLLCHRDNTGWTVEPTEEKFSASASLSFKNHGIARKASLGQLDSWLALTQGEVLLAGHIPMLDKFGYVARIAQREIPLPR